MMAEFLPWLSSSISSDEHHDMRKCLCKIVPEEKLLQQVWHFIHILVLGVEERPQILYSSSKLTGHYLQYGVKK